MMAVIIKNTALKFTWVEKEAISNPTHDSGGPGNTGKKLPANPVSNKSPAIISNKISIHQLNLT